jgi:Xaa-Pro aminopeptidase
MCFKCNSYDQRTPYSVGASDFQEGINFGRMRRERLERAQAALRRHGLAAAIFVRHENIRYTVSVKGHIFAPQLSYALVFADHEPILYELGDMVEHQKMYCPWLRPENIRFAYCWLDSICGPEAAKGEAKKFAESIVADLKAMKVLGERIGVDSLDDLGRNALRALGVELADAKPAIMEARRCKTPDEIACIETSVAIANAGYMSFMNFKPGMRERDGGAEVYKAMIKAGAEAVAGGVRSKYNTFDVYHVTNTDRIVDPGDLVTINTCGTGFAGYRVCMYRTFIVGRKPNDKERGWYEKCYDRVYGVIDAIKPGATTAEAAKKLLPASTWGYKSEQSLLVAEVGHGFGMTYEEPVISRVWSFDHPQTFEPGMVVAVESREGEWGYGGVRLEEMVLVTESGNRILSTWPAERITTVSDILS